MARINNPVNYTRKLKDDFTIVKRKMLKETYRLSQTDRNELIDCITRLEDLMLDEIEQILTNP